MARPTVLMPGPMNRSVLAGTAEQFEVIRLWEADDPDSVLAERGKDIVAVANSGATVDGAFLDKLPSLQIVASFGVGYDKIDATAAAERGVVVTNTPGVLDDEVADTALGLLLMTAREFPQAERYLRAGKWNERAYPLAPATLKGRTMGILGLGRIGEAIAHRAEAFGISIAYHNRRQKDVAYRYYPSLVEMARDVDILTIVIPGGDENRHLVNAEMLEALGPDGILINVSRGTVVDEAALVDALRSRTILSAGLDVFEHEPDVHPGLLELDNAVLLPHVGSATVPTRDAMGRLVVENLVSWFATGVPVTPVQESRDLVGRGRG
ncbi:lactate dehydrogenase-like 2-hydroxyacid dehydrogenase [Kribbella orskensis]|uniref:Lactate dehydrogenase-like 2-hydroxyacid dehydrogenase n=1 Tax=Kribbella orskensis TaxID=2512216 RepID=A0ABY2BKC1_9ACTN|nr:MULTISPECIES: 2-hydroxyacid dehydrogenase [Kribbella]TCN40146.1 lactate dehydrogenase-like 2-hydroxyacid dehydrogenase [Kribbella sp. VKM Ac-2500]TCO22766.1 lactate dehydrogenase-like 2-hydroxyacid dehydrogenase [Kribbella orskensis]